MLNGQQLQGPYTAEEVNYMLKNKNMEERYVVISFLIRIMVRKELSRVILCRFPLFTAIHQICKGELAPEQMIDCIRNHPEHM
jgi:glycerol-3-phosphate dehydrogenase (NAD+)